MKEMVCRYIVVNIYEVKCKSPEDGEDRIGNAMQVIFDQIHKQYPDMQVRNESIRLVRTEDEKG